MNEHRKNPFRILIVDDTPKNIQVLGTILKQEGYRLNVARNGLQALEMVEKVIPDLILLDIMMPEMDGFETCIRLKTSPETADIPIIFLTARTDTEDIVQGFKLGAVDYVTKPFNSMELLARVRTHLSLKSSKEIIEDISNERKELLHVLCHDLTNPFVAITGLVSIINDYQRFEDLKHHIQSAANNGLNLIRLVRDMRALEEYRLELGVFNLRQAVSESCSLLQKRYNEKQIQVDIHMDDDIGILAERTSFINSVLNNLFTNAIKFSWPESTIRVRAGRTPDGVELSIIDCGMGMPAEMVTDLFDLTKVTSRPGTEGETGTGFGMPLVKKFIKAYGGSIHVSSKDADESPEDHGTEIKLFLKTE